MPGETLTAKLVGVIKDLNETMKFSSRKDLE